MLQMFGREDLALAAYNGGPATVQRHRPMRMETLQYVLGIGYYKNILREHAARLRQEASQLGILRTAEGDSWWTLSQRTGVPMLLLRMYNPFLAPRPLRPGLALVYPPAGLPLPLETRSDPAIYIARPGDHYLTLAFALGVEPDEIRRANGLWHTDLLLPGMRLKVPLQRPGPAQDQAVEPGDDLAKIAARTGASEWDLVRDNALWDQSLEGISTLRVVPEERPPAYALYTVRRGDTLSSIADHHGVSVGTLRSVNGLPDGNAAIRAGQVLKIPAG
jgi:peptidoglycan lytic transglycosylase D